MSKITEKEISKDLKFDTLRRGDIVRKKIGGMSYVITQVNTYSAIAIRQIDISNECEWKVVK